MGAKLRKLALIAAVIFLAVPGSPLFAQGAASARAPEGWQNEFEEVCSQTQDATLFEVRDLKALIQRCDALVPQIEQLDETRKKVFLARLRQCRGVFAYVLETKSDHHASEAKAK